MKARPPFELKHERIAYKDKSESFRKDLEKSIGDYFKKNEISQYADGYMKVKILFLSCLFITEYALILSGKLQGWTLVLVLAAFVYTLFQTALTLGHDGSHHSISSNKKVNKILTYAFDFTGVNSYLWNFDHVISHHSTPNISGYDSNLYMYPGIRQDPYLNYKWFHKYQHIYAIFLYAHATIFKTFLADFANLQRKEIGFIRINKHKRKDVFRLIFTKMVVYGYAYIIPFLIYRESALLVLLGFYIGHLISGILLGLIFQVTHTNLMVSWAKADDKGIVKNSYFQHIFSCTADFSSESRVINWITGGLNVHAIHHVFPDISQSHLPALVPIVRSVCKKHQIEYREFKSWWGAISSHFEALKKFGNPSYQEALLNKA